MLDKRCYKSEKNIIAYARQKDINMIRYDELIMQFVSQNGYIKREDVVDLLHVTPSQAYRLLSKLSNNGFLKLEGKGRYSKYVKK